MKARFFLCAESISIDQRRNSLSLFHIVEDLNMAGFPAVIPYIAVVGMFDRAADEPNDPEGAQLVITLSNRRSSAVPCG
jgi:hypothetical protein